MYHLTPIRMAVIKKSINNKCWIRCEEKGAPLYTVGRNVSCCSHLWKKVWRFCKKLKIELPYDPAIPLLGIYPDKAVIQKDT